MITKAKNLKPGDKLTVGCYSVPITRITDLGPNSEFICVFFSDSPVGTSVFLSKNQRVGFIPTLPEKDGSLISHVEVEFTGKRKFNYNDIFVRRGEWFFHSPEDVIHVDHIVGFRHYEN